MVLPFVSDQWSKVLRSRLEKYLHRVQINDTSAEVDRENHFGEIFYKRLSRRLNDEAVNFDISMKLIPKETSGTSKQGKRERAVSANPLSSCIRRTGSLRSLWTTRRSVSVWHPRLRCLGQRRIQVGDHSLDSVLLLNRPNI